MTDPIVRIRSNWDTVKNLDEFTNFTAGAYAGGPPGGALLATQTHYGRRLPWPNFSYIWDLVNKPKDRDNTSGYYPSGPCFHIETILNGLTLEPGFMGGGNTVRWDIDGSPFTILNDDLLRALHVAHPDQINPDSFPGRLPDSLHDDLCEQAFNYFSDVFPASISFSEFVQGFTQLQDLIPKVGESITKTLSGGYLNKKFGWDNLLPDLETLGNLAGIVISRMEYLHRTYNVPTRLGFSRKDVYHPDLDDIYHPEALMSWAYRGIRCVEFTADFRATAWIRQHLDFIHDLAGFIRVLVGALGLNNPVKAFWNTVPLSFVVDWFFNISQHLDNLTRLNPAMGWDVVNMTNSVTYRYKFELELFDYPVTGFPKGSNKTECVDSTIYDRNLGLSFGWQLLNPADLSPTQLTLLLAMLHQLG
jgi:hypothetical protein